MNNQSAYIEAVRYKNYSGLAQLDIENNVWRGKVLNIRDLVTFEARRAIDLQQQFKAAIDDYIATCGEVGKSPKEAAHDIR